MRDRDSHAYDADFMDLAKHSSVRSARRIIEVVRSAFDVQSVLDVGCAVASTLRAWQESGVGDVHGIDGDYVDRARLEIAQPSFTAADLSRPIDLGRTFDLVESFEVAEHIPTSASETFVDTITRHSKGLVLFSAAPPGQGGEFHVNEQPYEFWRRLFAARGFEAFDYVRPAIKDDKLVSYWYRYNIILYMHRDRISFAPERVRRTQVQTVRDISPAVFQLRKAVVRSLPASVQDGLSRIKSRVFRTGRF